MMQTSTRTTKFWQTTTQAETWTEWKSLAAKNQAFEDSVVDVIVDVDNDNVAVIKDVYNLGQWSQSNASSDPNTAISCAIKVDQYYDDNLFKICTYLSLITFTPEQLIKQSQLDNTPDENNNV